MKYKKAGSGYQLAKMEVLQTSWRPKKDLDIHRVTLTTKGELYISEGYYWDGSTGMIDTDTNLRGSLGHDAEYNLSRMGLLPVKDHKKSDNDYCRWLKEDGSWDITIWSARKALSMMKGKYASPKQRKKIHEI